MTKSHFAAAGSARKMAARNPNLPNPADLEAVWRFLEEVRPA